VLGSREHLPRGASLVIGVFAVSDAEFGDTIGGAAIFDAAGMRVGVYRHETACFVRDGL